MNLANKLLQNCSNMPDKICLVQNDEKITYKNLYNKVLSFKKYLENHGIAKGSRVLVLIPMSKELYITLLAMWTLGAIPCFMDAGFIRNGVKRNEFDEIDALVGTSKYIAYSNINKNLRKLNLKINVEILKKLNESTQLQVSRNKKLQLCVNNKYVQKNKELKIENDEKLTVEKLEDDFSAILTYTSGTTGKPKIVARSHKFLKLQGDILEKEIKYDKDDIELSTIPIFTLSNINVGITTVIANGNYSNLGKSSAKKLIKQIEKDKINRLMASPGVLEVVTNYCIKKQKKLLNVNKIFTGGGAVFLDFIDNLKQTFPNAKIVTMYGSTEAEPIATLDLDDMTKEELENTKTGMGILAGNIVGVDDCKIIKTGIKQIGNITKKEFLDLQTEVGEIVVSGKNVLEGYVGGIGDAENKFSVDGKKYHRTGDVGYIDKNNKLWLRGRVSEPYFNIEAMLHSNLKVGKTAIFSNNEKIILVLEKNNKISDEDIKKIFDLKSIDEIKYVKKIPVDKRHSTKVDYKELRKILKI